LNPHELAQQHRGYYFWVVMGPSYRADAWAALEQYPSLSTAELARRSYCAFATSWQVKRDFFLLLLLSTLLDDIALSDTWIIFKMVDLVLNFYSVLESHFPSLFFLFQV
jgi:hypothetical protein